MLFSLQWLHILDITLRVMCWCGMAAIDTSILMEVAMRLALLLETSASTTALQKMTGKQLQFCDNYSLELFQKQFKI